MLGQHFLKYGSMFINKVLHLKSVIFLKIKKLNNNNTVIYVPNSMKILF